MCTRALRGDAVWGFSAAFFSSFTSAPSRHTASQQYYGGNMLKAQLTNKKQDQINKQTVAIIVDDGFC